MTKQELLNLLEQKVKEAADYFWQLDREEQELIAYDGTVTLLEDNEELNDWLESIKSKDYRKLGCKNRFEFEDLFLDMFCKAVEMEHNFYDDEPYATNMLGLEVVNK